MKIVHICLACFYVEGMGYQENILPQKHAAMGHDVVVITSDYSFNHAGEKIKKDKKEYTNEFGILVKVLDKTKHIPILYKYGEYSKLYQTLISIKPDIIFVHGGQFISLSSVIKYKRKNKETKLYIDQHGDYYNMSCRTLKEKIVQKIIYGHYIRKAVKYCNKFWGVTPWRCEYLHNVYGVPKDKIELLIMGGDDDKIHFNQADDIRKNIREKLKLGDNDFVLITGGKIDKSKNIHLLMQAVSELNEDNLKLIVFGQPDNKMASLIDKLSKDIHIRYIGWLDSSDVYNYFLASDLAVFPGTHSVMWEQAVACGIPLIVKDWEGMHHVDVGGNCLFLQKDDIEEIKEKINNVYHDVELYKSMLKVAKEKGISIFSYKEIAKRSIEENE